MTEHAMMDCLEGTGPATPRFPDLDQLFRLKPRAYVDLCMPPAFEQYAQATDLYELRRSGIYPIMYYLDFAPAPLPLVFGAPVEVAYRAHLRRYRPPAGSAPAPGAPSTERLLVDFRFDLKGKRGSGEAQEMDPTRGSEKLEPAGIARIVLVATRLLGPPGERQVTELPPRFRRFQEHDWAEPYPTWERLALVPEGFEAPPGAAVASRESLWGLPNTDINQHVNLTEYMSKAEDHFTRLLEAAGLPHLHHRVARTEVIFLKPFFAGERFRISGRLWARNGQTLLLGALHKPDRDDAWPAEGDRPAVFLRYEGLFEGQGD